MQKNHGDHIEAFGVRQSVGDVVGCFLDAGKGCISKKNEHRVFEFKVTKSTMSFLMRHMKSPLISRKVQHMYFD